MLRFKINVYTYTEEDNVRQKEEKISTSLREAHKTFKECLNKIRDNQVVRFSYIEDNIYEDDIYYGYIDNKTKDCRVEAVRYLLP